MLNIAFIGLGNMGLPMAKNMVDAGFTIIGMDQNPAAVSAFQEAGGRVAKTVAEAVTNARVVITMLPNAGIVKNVYESNEGVFANAPEKALLIDCSTIDVDTARSLSTTAADQGFDMLDAPVSGGVAGAAAGTLAFMVGGDRLAVEKAMEILQPMASKIVHTGGSGNGQAAKVCNNMLLAISMIGVSEAFNLGRALGLDDQTFFDVAANASGQCWSLTSYCPVPGPVPHSPANRDYKPGFAVDLMLKDLKLAQEALGSTGVAAPLGQASAGIYEALAQNGMGGQDFSAVINYLKSLEKAV